MAPIQSVANGKSEREEEDEVGPEDAVADRLHLVDEVVVVDPVDADLDEGEQVEEDGGEDGAQASHAILRRHLELEHHDGDDDGDDAVGEGLETGWG